MDPSILQSVMPHQAAEERAGAGAAADANAGTDADGIGNNKDTDDDNDGILDAKDTFPLVVNTQTQGDAGLEGFAIPEQVKVLETK